MLVGNGRLEAAKAIGWSHVAIVRVEDDATTATGYSLADNRTAELAEWDEAALAELVAELADGEGDLLAAMLLDDLAATPEVPEGEGEAGTLEYHVIVSLPDEAAQERFYEKMQVEGRPCRLVMS